MAALRFFLGNSNAYLVPAEDGYVLVDAGLPGIAWPALRRGLARQRIDPQRIRLIVVTHVHFDHVGALARIKAASGAPVMVHASEADLLQRGTVVIPPGANGYGRMAHRVGTAVVQAGLLRFTPVTPDLVVEDCTPVDNFGLHAQVIHTPGHTAGSLSLVVEDAAFVGDLAANHLPWGHGPVLPPFFGDRAALETSWRRVLAGGAARIYPGHGPSFPAQWLQDRLTSG